MTVTSGLRSYGPETQKDKERQQRIESDIRWGLKDPESGEVAQVPRVAFAENLRAQGSGLSTRQAEGSRVVRVVVGKPREAAGEAAQDRQTAGFIL